MTTPRTTRKRRTDHKMSLADYLRKHSPVKPGVIVKDEDKPLAKYNKIMDRLYLGNYQAAKDRDFFMGKKIKAVLNCSKDRDLPNTFAHIRDIEYMRIPVDDSLREKDFDLMYQYMPCIVEFIDKHVNIAKQNILVHCFAGRQRSAIAIASYLVAKHKMTPHEACRYVVERRPEAFHFGESLNFESSLLKFHKDVAKKPK